METKKFAMSKLGSKIAVVVDVVILGLYIGSLYLSKQEGIAWQIIYDVLSNILLMAFSILTTALITIPLVDVRSQNTLCEQFLFGDVLLTPAIFSSISDERKRELLRSLDSNLYFDNCPQKGAMYESVRSKINTIPYDSGSDKAEHISGIYFESCEYIVECRREDRYIVKDITKNIAVCAYKPQTVHNFPLSVSRFSEELGKPYLDIVAFSIGGRPLSVEDNIGCTNGETEDTFSQKRGYKKKYASYYKHPLDFCPGESVRIALSYTTTVLDNDTSFTCRMSYPCHRFNITFKLTGELAEEYNIDMDAFGFYDNGEKTHNKPGGDEACVSFDDWIFPSDGVSVSLLAKSPSLALSMN